MPLWSAGLTAWSTTFGPWRWLHPTNYLLPQTSKTPLALSTDPQPLVLSSCICHHLSQSCHFSGVLHTPPCTFLFPLLLSHISKSHRVSFRASASPLLSSAHTFGLQLTTFFTRLLSPSPIGTPKTLYRFLHMLTTWSSSLTQVTSSLYGLFGLNPSKSLAFLSNRTNAKPGSPPKSPHTPTR